MIRMEMFMRYSGLKDSLYFWVWYKGKPLRLKITEVNIIMYELHIKKRSKKAIARWAIKHDIGKEYLEDWVMSKSKAEELSLKI